MDRTHPIAPTTRTAARAALAEHGVTGAAAELALDATGRDRHRARSARYRDQALEEWRRVAHLRPATAIPKDREGEARSYALAVLVIEAFGLVETSGSSGDLSNIHHRAFRDSCGARTGPAATSTRAALLDGFLELYEAATDQQSHAPWIVVEPSLEPVGVCIRVEGVAPVVLAVEPTPELDAQPPLWLQSIALEAVRRGINGEPRVRLGGEVPDAPQEAANLLRYVRLDGALDAWGRVLNATFERRKLVGLSERLARLAKAYPALPPYAPPDGPTWAYAFGWIAQVLPYGLADAILEEARTGDDRTAARVNVALYQAEQWIADHRKRVLDRIASRSLPAEYAEPAAVEGLAIVSMLLDVSMLRASGAEIDGDRAALTRRAFDRAVATYAPEGGISIDAADPFFHGLTAPFATVVVAVGHWEPILWGFDGDDLKHLGALARAMADGCFDWLKPLHSEWYELAITIEDWIDREAKAEAHA